MIEKMKKLMPKMICVGIGTGMRAAAVSRKDTMTSATENAPVRPMAPVS